MMGDMNQQSILVVVLLVLVGCGGAEFTADQTMSAPIAIDAGADVIAIDAAPEATTAPDGEETVDAMGPDGGGAEGGCSAMPSCTGSGWRHCSGEVVNACGAVTCDSTQCERGTCTIATATGVDCSCTQVEDDAASVELCAAPGRLWVQAYGATMANGCGGGCTATGMVISGAERYCCN